MKTGLKKKKGLWCIFFVNSNDFSKRVAESENLCVQNGSLSHILLCVFDLAKVKLCRSQDLHSAVADSRGKSWSNYHYNKHL